MKKLFLFFLISFFFSCSSSQQLKLNKNNDVDIILKKIPEKRKSGKTFNYEIRNNTNNTYIIDPMGFIGSITYFENSNIAPLMPYPEGYFYRASDIECQKDLIILKPNKIINASIALCSNLNGYYLDVYKISPRNNYFYLVKSIHNKETIKKNGCNNYIYGLENQGYKILEDSIVAKVQFIPDFRWSKDK